MIDASCPRLGVAGVGLIGGSIALRARALGARVVGFDRDPVALQIANASGMLDDTASSFAKLAAGVDVLVLAGPLDATLAQIAELVAHPSCASAIFDVASLKVPVSLAARGIRAFVGTHPIAGSERSGPGAARADLFEGRVWTLDAAADPAARSMVRALIERLGARTVEIDSAEHDRTIALTSHLPQLLSVALGALLLPRLDRAPTLDLCGTGVRSMLRLGTSSWPMWRAVLDVNGVSVAQEVRRLAAILTEAAESLETHAVDALETRFASATIAAARLSDAGTDRKGES